MAQAPAPATQEQIAAANMQARRILTSTAIDAMQPVFSGTFSVATQPVLNVTPRNVGLLKGFVIVVSIPVNTGAGVTATRTTLGPSNILSSIVFNDLNNNTRINTMGWHMFLLNTARRRRLSGSQYTSDSPVALSTVGGGIAAPASISPSSSGTVQMVYEVPVAYSNDDLRGAIYSAVVSANMNLQLTINPAFIVASGANATQAGYTCTGGLATLGNMTVTVYQQYLDQLPMTQNGPLLPLKDLSTLYLINNTNLTGLSAGQEFPMPYSNFRDFLSTVAVYDNGGTLSALGTDINYWSLQSANFTNIFRYDRFIQSFNTRNLLGNDFPAGCYYFDHRRKPISTVQFGNMNLIINPVTVNANAAMLLGYEAFGSLGDVIGAASIAGG